jgi:hypothetical protein
MLTTAAFEHSEIPRFHGRPRDRSLIVEIHQVNEDAALALKADRDHLAALRSRLFCRQMRLDLRSSLIVEPKQMRVHG